MPAAPARPSEKLIACSRVKHADSLGAVEDDFVLREIAVQLVDLLVDAVVHDPAAALDPAWGKVEGDSAEPEVVAHHPAARGPLEKVQDQLPLFDRVERRA